MLLDYFKILYNKYMEAINYLVFGVLSVVINVVVYYLCAECLGINYLLGNFFAWFCSVLFSFVTNKLFVFENKSNSIYEWLSQGIMFVGARILTGCVDMMGMYIMVGKMYIDKMISKYAMNILVIVLNYIFSKLWIFRKKEAC